MTFGEAGLRAGNAPRSFPRILVLPPATGDRGVDPLEFQLAQSLIHDLTLTLCRSHHFEVIAPFTARQLVGGTEITEAPAFDYRVSTAVIAGHSSSASAILLLSMTGAGTDQVIYSNEIEVASGRLLDIHHGVCAILAEQIVGRIGREEMSRYRRSGAASAYVHYLIAMQFADRHDLPSLLRAQKALRRSTQLSPDYVPALSQLARSMTLEWLERATEDRTLLQEAMHLAERANRYDPADSGSLREIGHASLYLHDLGRALDSFEAAQLSAPNHADLLADQADVLTHASRWDEAETRISRALALNPLAPDDYYWIGGAVSFFRGNYQEALRRLTTMKSPGLALRLMAACAAMIKDADSAERYRTQALERDPSFRVEKWTNLYPQPDKRDVALYLHALRQAGFE